MESYNNLFSDVKNGEKIFLSFESNYLVINGNIDSRILESLTTTFLEYPNNEFIINDKTNLLHEILEKINFPAYNNITIISRLHTEIDYRKFDKIFILETLKDEIEEIFNKKGYSKLNIIYFPISLISNSIYSFKGKSYKIIEQESLFPKTIQKIIDRNSLNENKAIESIIILDDHIRDFYIGDTHLWLSAIRQIQLKTSSTIIIACGNKNFYKKVSQIFTLHPFPSTSIILLNWDALDIKHFDTIICHHNSILPFLHFYKRSFKFLSEKKVYRFAPNTEFKNLKISYPWDINHYFKKNYQVENSIQSIRQLKKQIHKEIYLSNEEINEANIWLKENGYLFGERIFILIDEASYSKKVLDFKKTVNLIKSILSNPENKILIFDYQNSGKKSKLQSFLTKSECNKIISVNGQNIRKEMAIMASSAIYSIIGPCTGMMHLANGIYFELLNSKRRSKQEIPTLIVYCGSGLDVDNYHPRYWWQGTMVKCIALIKKNGIIKPEELHEIPLDIKQFHKYYLPVSSFTPEHIMLFLNK